MSVTLPVVPNSRESFRFTEAAMIAAAPAIAYILTYAYAFGYASAFSIPTEFISVTWSAALVVLMIMVFVVIQLWSLTSLILLPLTWGPVSRRVMKYIPWFLLIFVEIVLHGKNWHRYWVPTMTFALVAASDFCWPLLFFRDGKRNYSEMLQEQDDREGKADRPFEHFNRKVLTHSIVRGGVTVLLFAFISQAIGTFWASNQASFYVTAGSPETVVLAIYVDTVISARLDRTSKIVQREFFVSRLSSGSPLDLRVEDVGPLRPADK